MQKITSKNTSINKLAAFYKKAVKAGIIGEQTIVLDYGCGKNLEYLSKFADENNFAVIGFDPYHLDDEANKTALHHASLKHVDFVACNNVMNVLQDQDLKLLVLKLQVIRLKYKIPVYFTVYEGDKSGQGRETKKDCYQRNNKATRYVEYLKDFFDNVTIKNGIIKAY